MFKLSRIARNILFILGSIIGLVIICLLVFVASLKLFPDFWITKSQTYLSRQLQSDVLLKGIDIDFNASGFNFSFDEAIIGNSKQAQNTFNNFSFGIDLKSFLLLKTPTIQSQLEQATFDLICDSEEICFLGDWKIDLTESTTTDEFIKELNKGLAFKGLIDLQVNQIKINFWYKNKIKQDLFIKDLELKKTLNNITISSQLQSEALGNTSVKIATHLKNTEKKSLEAILKLDWTELNLSALNEEFKLSQALKVLDLKEGNFKLIIKNNKFDQFNLKTAIAKLEYKDQIDKESLYFQTMDSDVEVYGPIEPIFDHFELLQANSTDSLNLYIKSQLNDFILIDKNNLRYPVYLEKIDFDGIYTHHEIPYMNINELAIDDQHIKTKLSGIWNYDEPDSSGIANLKGQLDYLNLPFLSHLLPITIDAEALDWLDEAFISGYMTEGSFTIVGKLDHYPYGLQEASGKHHIKAKFNDLVLKYHLATEDVLWPAVHSPRGDFEFKQDQISLYAAHAEIKDKQDQKIIDIKNLQAQMDSLEQNSMVHVKAINFTEAASFMSFIKETPLSPLLNHSLDKSQAKGLASFDLELNIPVMDPDNTKVKGNIYTDNMNYRFEPEYPEIKQIKSVMSFSEQDFNVQSLTGKALGGEVKIKGPIGDSKQPLSILGTFTAQGLADYLSIDRFRRIQGQSTYDAKLYFLDDGNVNAQLSTNLQGLAFNLPNSLHKQADLSWPSKITWLSKDSSLKSHENALKIELNKQHIQALFKQNNNSSHASFFEQGAFSIGEKPRLTGNGTHIHGSLNQIFFEDWLDVYSDFQKTFLNATNSNQRQIFPDITEVSLGVNDLNYEQLNLGEVNLKVRRPKFNHWHIDFDGQQARGNLIVQNENNTNNIASLVGNFSHLNLTTRSDQTIEKKLLSEILLKSDWQVKQAQLNINKGFINEFPVNQFEFKGQQLNSHTWRLLHLSANNKSGSFFMTGDLTALADRIKAELNFNLNSQDFSEVFESLNYPRVLDAGAGYIEGSAVINDIRDISLENIEINALGELKKGLLSQLNSRSIKALHLVSLQSILKLPKLKENITGVFSEGLDFDLLRFHLGYKDNIAWVPDFRLNNSAISIVASGKSQIDDEHLTFDVVAIPHLDISGASVVAGFLVNPAVGVSAFLSQLFLQGPIEKSLAKQYEVTGTWDDPEIKSVPLKP